MPATTYYQQLAKRRKARVRAKLHGTTERPRLTVFRSNKYVYLQVIDDTVGKTLASAHSYAGKGKPLVDGKMKAAVKAAEVLLEQLHKNKITALVFDRGAYRYHGRIKAVADTLRAGKINV